MTVSIKQIAEASNVSMTTVSRVLRGQGEISAGTRARVEEAARKLKYRPNLLVKGIQTGHTQTIGVLMSPGDPFLAQILTGIVDALAEADHAPIVLRACKDPAGYHGPNELEQIHRLVDRRVDGVILRPVEDAASDDYLKEIWERELPLVAVDRQLAYSHADFVGSDDRGGATQAAEHLLQRGHRRLGHISGPSFASTGRDRREAFLAAVAACPGATCQTLEDSTFSDGYYQALELLKRSDRPTALFAGNDLIAEGIYRATAELGLRIPHDLSVVGFCDMDFARWMRPMLTTIRQDARQIGREAAILIVKRIAGEFSRNDVQTIRVPTELIVRESTAPCAP